jgi:hypothetical protein
LGITVDETDRFRVENAIPGSDGSRIIMILHTEVPKTAEKKVWDPIYYRL